MKKKFSKNRLFITTGLGVAFAGIALVTLVSCGQETTYTVTFNTNGGSAIAPIKVPFGMTFQVPENPTRVGYTFANWFKDAGLTQAYGPNELSELKVDSDITIYAGWNIKSYRITFETNGGTECNPITAQYGSTITNLPTSTKNYYSFAGWFMDEDFEKQFTTSTPVPANDLTLYANWSGNTYNISFSGNAMDAKGEMNAITISQDSTEKKLPKNKFSRVGYTFSGWNDKSDGSGELSIEDEASIGNVETNATITLYAQWEPNNYKVVFTTDGATEFDSKVLPYNSNVINTTKVPAKEGYSFEGWGNPELDTTSVFNPETYYFKANVNDFGKITSYTPITLTSNTYEANKFYEIKVSPEGYKVDLEGTTLYARFLRKQSTISLIDGDDQRLLGNYTGYYGDGLVLPTPTKSGYTFAGWVDNDGKSVGFNVNYKDVSTTYKATWTKNNYHVNYITNCDRDLEPSEVIFNNEINYKTLTEADKPGYTFAGWFLDNGKAVPTIMPANDLTVYAKWTANAVDVTVKVLVEDVDNGGFKPYATEVISALTDTQTSIESISLDLVGYTLDTVDEKTVKGDGTTEIEAKYLANEYTVKFNIDKEGDTSSINASIKYGAKLSSILDTAGVVIPHYTNTYKIDNEEVNPIGIRIEKDTTVDVIQVENTSNLSAIANGGSFSDGSPIKDVTGAKYNDNIVELINEVPVRKGYTFDGWFDESLEEEIITMPDTVEPLSVYAKWTANSIAVTYHSNFGDPEETTTKTMHTSDDSYELEALSFTRDGYYFVGWALSSEGEVVYDANNYALTLNDFDFDTTSGTQKTLDLYAIWASKTISVRYLGNGNTSGIMPVQVYSYEEDFLETDSKPLADCNYKRIGYTFAGWVDASNQPISNITRSDFDENNKTIEVRASWSQNEYTITFDLDGGSVIDGTMPEDNKIVGHYGDSISAPVVTLQKGTEKFTGWFTEDGKLFNFSTIPAEDVTLTAHYVDDSSKVMIVNGHEVYTTKSSTTDGRELFREYVKLVYNSIAGYDEVYECITRLAGATAASELGKQAQEGTTLGAIALILNDIPAAQYVPALMINLDVPEANVESVLADWTQIPSDSTIIYSNITGQQYHEALQTLAGEALIDGNTPQSFKDKLAAAKVVIGTCALAGDIYERIADPSATPGFVACEIANRAAPVISVIADNMPIPQYAEYLTFIASKAAEMQQEGADATAIVAEMSATTSVLRADAADEYAAYESNAYNPVSEIEGQVFDGWEETSDGSITRYIAQFVEQLPAVTNLHFKDADQSGKVYFEWDKVTDKDVYGYRINVINEDTGDVVLENFINIGADNTTLELKDALEGVTYRVIVEVLHIGDNQHPYVEYSKEFHATSLVDDTIELDAPIIKLTSEEATTSYKYKGSGGEVIDPTKSGPDYYRNSEGKFYFFANGIYGFKGYTVVGQVGDIVTLNDGKIVTSNKTGEFIFFLDSVDDEHAYTAEVLPLFNNVDLGKSYNQWNNTQITSNINNKAEEEYFAPSGSEKVIYKVGFASTDNYKYSDYSYFDGTNVYYNGIRLDFNAVASDGSTINPNSFEYSFEVTLNGDKKDSAADYIKYDKNNNVVYLLSDNMLEGDKLTIKAYPNCDEANVGFILVPNYIKDEIREQVNKGELSRKYYKEFSVVVGEGANVSSANSLRAAMADTETTKIFILNDIEARLAPSMVGSVETYKKYGWYNNPDWGYSKLVEYNSPTKDPHGELDIVDGSAIMKKSGTPTSPKCWELLKSGKVPEDVTSFSGYYEEDGVSKLGTFYWKDGGSYYIDDCRFIQNETSGRFKINNDNVSTKTYNMYATREMLPANIFYRYGYSANSLIIEGNYFKIDGSKLPLVFTEKPSSTGFAGSTYHIQNTVSSIMCNASYGSTVKYHNLTVVSNTGNTSGNYASGQSTTDIKTLMERSSGGFDGIMGRDWDAGNNQWSDSILEGVNVYNATIGIYCDTSADISYCRVQNSWANNLYCYAERDTTYKVDHIAVSSSGGPCIQPENHGKNNKPITLTVNMNYGTCDIDANVSGEEQWFKAWNMEIVVMGLKTQMEDGLQSLLAKMKALNPDGYNNLFPNGASLIHEVVDAKGVVSEKLNIAYFGKSDSSTGTVENRTSYTPVGVMANCTPLITGMIGTDSENLFPTDESYTQYVNLFVDTAGHYYFYVQLLQPGMGYDQANGWIYVALEVFPNPAPSGD